MAWRRWGAPTTGRLQAVDRRLAVRLEPGPVVLLGVAVEARAAVVPVAVVLVFGGRRVPVGDNLSKEAAVALQANTRVAVALRSLNAGATFGPELVVAAVWVVVARLGDAVANVVLIDWVVPALKVGRKTVDRGDIALVVQPAVVEEVRLARDDLAQVRLVLLGRACMRMTPPCGTRPSSTRPRKGTPC